MPHFQHAFDLVDPPAIIVDIATRYRNIYPSRKFVRYLIDHRLHEIAPADATDGDVVVYFSERVIMHAGKLQGGQIVSKWGTAHMWRHGLFEVPGRYGDTVKFYRAIDASDSQRAFLEYAAECSLGAKRLSETSEERDDIHPCTTRLGAHIIAIVRGFFGSTLSNRNEETWGTEQGLNGPTRRGIQPQGVPRSAAVATTAMLKRLLCGGFVTGIWTGYLLSRQKPTWTIRLLFACGRSA